MDGWKNGWKPAMTTMNRISVFLFYGMEEKFGNVNGYTFCS